MCFSYFMRSSAFILVSDMNTKISKIWLLNKPINILAVSQIVAATNVKEYVYIKHLVNSYP